MKKKVITERQQGKAICVEKTAVIFLNFEL